MAKKKKLPKAKAGYLLAVDPKKLTYEDLPEALAGMFMDPGPRIPGIKKSIADLYPPGEFGPNLERGIHPIPGPVPLGTPPDTSKIPGPPAPTYDSNKPKEKNNFNWGDAALLGLSAFDALLPNPVSRQQVVQPQMAYNPQSYGYGSQALMQDGGSVHGSPKDLDRPTPMPKTRLTKEEEVQYQAWKAKLPPRLQYEENYNLRQLWKDNPNQKPGPNMHLPDWYKLPNHPSFSNHSRYMNPMNMYRGGEWHETDSTWNYIPYNDYIKPYITERKGMENGGYVPGEDENNSPSAKNGKQMKSKKNTGAALFGFTVDDLPEAKDGHWIQKAVNPAHKGYCTPMTKSTCTPKRKALAKTFKKMAKNRKKDHGGIIPDPMSNFSPHEYEYGGDVNGCAHVKEVGPNYPNKDLMEQWLLYEQGGNVNGGADIREVGPNYPNADLIEQWLLYADGGPVDPEPKRKPIYTSDPNDPRIKAYKDSLRLSKSDLAIPYGERMFNNKGDFKKNVKTKIKESGLLKDGLFVDDTSKYLSGIQPVDYADFDHNPSAMKQQPYTQLLYKRPVQPVEYKDPERYLNPSVVRDKGDYHLGSIPEPGYNPRAFDPRTAYSATFPEGGQQHTIYFPNQGMLSEFANMNSGLLIDSQERPGRGSVTLKNRPMEYGGQMREVGPYYPNTDLLEQWIQYENGGSLSAAKAKEMLKDGTANGKKLTKKQKRYFGMVAAGKAALGDVLTDPTKPVSLSPQEKYYQSSAKLSYYKDQLNQKLKAKNPQAYTDYFKGLVDLRRANNPTGASKYVQDTPYNEYLSPQEVQSTLGDKYNDYLESIRSVNTYNVVQGQQPLYGNVEGQDDLSKLNYGRRFASMQVTPSASVTNKDKGTTYRRSYTYDPNKNVVDYTEEGDMKLKPNYLSDRPIPTITFKHGGVMYDDGGNVETMWGGSADLESYNPYDGGTIEFNGASHDNGGIGMAYNGNPVEVEGGEYASKDTEGNLNIFGNMYIPGTKTKFKQAAKGIASKEKRYNFLKDRGSKLVNESNPANKYDQLAFNAGRVMMQGGEMGQADLADKKERLASLQKEMLNMASIHGLDPFEMSKGKMKKARKGASITSGDPDGNDPTRADRNMNPGNIKYGSFAKKYGAKRDKDGFAIFPDRKTGEKAMQDLLTGKNYKDLSVREAIHKWTGKHPYRYDLGPLTDKTVGDLNRDELDIVLATMKQGEGTRYGMTPRKVPGTPRNTPTPQVPVPNTPYTPYTIPDIPLEPGITPVDPVNPVPPYDQLEVPTRGPIPSNVEPLHLNQVLGEIYGAATNKVEPVPAQRYEPQLYVPYQVSFQDRLNANQSAFNAQSRAAGAGNPSALGVLGAQKYQADQQVYGDEFRTNQAIANDITNKNISLVNDANLKNLGIADTQMVRQSQARSKTRELNQMILNSLSSKYAQNDFENKRLAAYENLYDYRFVPQEDGGLSATYFGPNAMFNYSGKGANSSYTDPSRRITRYDQYGNVKGYAEYDDSQLRDEQRLIDLEMKRRKLPLMTTPPLNGK